MRNTKYWVGPALVLTLIAGIISLRAGQNTKPLSESDLIKRLKVLDEDEVLTLVKERGIAFTADAAVLGRLKDAGASAKVLAAVRQAAANRPGNAIEYGGLLKLLKDGVAEKEILKQVENSPTRFVPSAEQVRELRKAGASERLLAALQQDRTAISSDIAEYAVILDCSGSMADRTPEGPSKMYAAKKAVTDLIRKLPDGKLLTFTVYGHKVFGKDKKRGCEAVEVVCSGRELTPKLKDALAKAINTLQPVGWTPLALAIRTTGDELRKRKHMCEFLVITDGMETCDGDPALEAKKLNQALNLPSGVNVILFGGDDKEKEAVKKIADEGGGKYYDAGSIRDLLQGLDDVRERTRVAAKVKTAEDQVRRAEAAAEEAEEAATSAKKWAEQASGATADVDAAKPAADRAKQSAQKASAAAVEAREASGEAKKAADTARGMKSEADAAAQVQIASTAADKAADKAKEARSAAEDTQEAVKGVRLALAEGRKPREEPKDDEPDKAAKEDKLPYSDRVHWDVSLLNNKKDFTLVKQTVTDKEVRWVVEINSDEGVRMATNRYLGNPNYGNLRLQFLDEDDVEISYYHLSSVGKVAKGERVRFSYPLPKEGFQKTKKVLLVDSTKLKKKSKNKN